MRPELDADAGWVASLAVSSRERAESALGEAREERSLFAHISREHDREGRSSYVEIDAPLELYALVRLLRPRQVVEVGVSSGVSTAYLLAALRRNGRGKLCSVDLPSLPVRKGPIRGASWSLPPGRSTGWAIPPTLRRGWTLRLGDKRELLPEIARELPQIGLFVYDVPHDDRTSRDEFAALDAAMPAGGVAIVDHGPGGGRCGALTGWARGRGSTPVGRRGLGLYGARLGRRGRPGGAVVGRRSPPMTS